MPDWVVVGDNILNLDQIEWIERIPEKKSILVSMASGKQIELTGTMALEVWKYIDGERLKLLSLTNPKRDFRS
jgi:hypothetical protein